MSFSLKLTATGTTDPDAVSIESATVNLGSLVAHILGPASETTASAGTAYAHPNEPATLCLDLTISGEMPNDESEAGTRLLDAAAICAWGVLQDPSVLGGLTAQEAQVNGRRVIKRTGKHSAA